MLPYSILQAMVVIALAFWAHFGPVTPPEISVVVWPVNQFGPNVPAAQFPNTDPCLIRVFPLFGDIDAALQQLVITHEVGHCFGLGHIKGPGIMNPLTIEQAVESPADHEEFYWAHPEIKRVYRVFAPSVAH